MNGKTQIIQIGTIKMENNKKEIPEKIKEYISSYDLELCQLGVNMLIGLNFENDEILTILNENIKYPNKFAIDTADLLDNKLSIRIFSVELGTDSFVIDLWQFKQKVDMPLLTLSHNINENIVYGNTETFKWELPYVDGKNIPTII